MRIREVMTPDVVSAHPDTTLNAAAEMMGSLNVSLLPVVSGERVVGIVSDHDIVVRGLALGMRPDQASVADVMTREVYTCREDEEAQEVARHMSELGVRRLPVVDERRRLVGIVTRGDLALRSRRGRLEQQPGEQQPGEQQPGEQQPSSGQ